MRQDIYGRLFKPYGIKPQYLKDGKISLYAFNNYTLKQLLNFSQNFSRVMNYEQVFMKKQSTTTHDIYTFYEDRKKTKTYMITLKDKYIENLKGETNLLDPYIHRIAHHEKIITFKKRYIKISNWIIDHTSGYKTRLEVNTETMQTMICYKFNKSNQRPFRIPQKVNQFLNSQKFQIHPPKYAYDNWINEIRFKPETLQKTAKELAKQFGRDESTIKRWKRKTKQEMNDNDTNKTDDHENKTDDHD